MRRREPSRGLVRALASGNRHLLAFPPHVSDKCSQQLSDNRFAWNGLGPDPVEVRVRPKTAGVARLTRPAPTELCESPNLLSREKVCSGQESVTDGFPVQEISIRQDLHVIRSRLDDHEFMTTVPSRSDGLPHSLTEVSFCFCSNHAFASFAQATGRL